MLFAIACGEAASAESLATAFPPPDGAVRHSTDDFGRWLLQLKVKPPHEPIKTYDGRVVHHRGRVIDLPMVRGDLQQCADSAIRLRAEWLRANNGVISFHATSGDPMPWARYRDGERPYEEQGRIRWKKESPGSWEGYLTRVFIWAGTRSLRYDTVPADAPKAGDLLVIPGSPGHAVVVLDVARRGEEILVLIGEGYMPAQAFHVELGPESGWWSYTAGIQLMHWDMREAELRRWKSDQ